jgi:hypothetical protein
MNPLAICRPPHLLIELVRGELESGKHISCGGDRPQHRTSGATRQLDPNPLRRLSRASFMPYVDVDPISLAIELCQALQPGLRAAAELSANGRVVGPDDDIHLATSLT